MKSSSSAASVIGASCRLLSRRGIASGSISSPMPTPNPSASIIIAATPACQPKSRSISPTRRVRVRKSGRRAGAAALVSALRSAVISAASPSTRAMRSGPGRGVAATTSRAKIVSAASVSTASPSFLSGSGAVSRARAASAMSRSCSVFIDISPSLFLFDIVQLLRKRSPPARQKTFNSLDRAVERLADFRVRPCLEMPEHDRLALALGQFGDRGGDRAAGFGLCHAHQHARLRINGFRHILDRRRGAPPAETIDAEIVDDAVKPGRDPGLARAPIRRLTPEAEHRLLCHILGLVLVAQHAPCLTESAGQQLIGQDWRRLLIEI